MAVLPMKTSEEPDASAPEWATIEQVFAALESPLLAYARRLLGDFAVAEDVVQDAFMKLHSQFHQVRTPQPRIDSNEMTPGKESECGCN